jgi:hypothetical protein
MTRGIRNGTAGKKQAGLAPWPAEVDKPQAKASEASAGARLEMNRQIKVLEGKIEAGKATLAEVAEAGDDGWESIKDGMESAWDSGNFAFSEAVSKWKG